MKARVESEWATRGVRVWLYEEHLDGLRIMELEDGRPVLREMSRDAAVVADPTFVLPEEALEALIREASGIMMPSDATVDALRDAREVRDRLLSMFERAQR